MISTSSDPGATRAAASTTASTNSSRRFSGTSRPTQTIRRGGATASIVNAAPGSSPSAIAFGTTCTLSRPAARRRSAWCADGDTTASTRLPIESVTLRSAESRGRTARLASPAANPRSHRVNPRTPAAAITPAIRGMGACQKKVCTVCTVGMPRSRAAATAAADSPNSECRCTTSMRRDCSSSSRCARSAALLRTTGRSTPGKTIRAGTGTTPPRPDRQFVAHVWPAAPRSAGATIVTL